MKLFKGHGLRNDYLVVHEGPPMTPDLVQWLCDRHAGVGADGVLEPTGCVDDVYGLRIWNPDGSLAEKSGNGLRIFARYLHQVLRADNELVVGIGDARIECSVSPETISVQMGPPSFEPQAIPCTTTLYNTPCEVDGDALILTAVGMGNPHCVSFVDVALDELPWKRWGAWLETAPWFPNRANVQFARVIDPHHIEIRIWERGAGPTEASGSSSCAVAAAALKMGLVGSPVTVQMPGGGLVIEQKASGLLLKGPAVLICQVETLDAQIA